MYAREKIYGMMAVAALLMAGCSQDDPTAEDETASSAVGRRAIGFGSVAVETDTAAWTTRTGTPNRETLTLRNTGFCVYASKSSGAALDLMYNQEVTYAQATYPELADHWTYSPQKYWPTDYQDMRLHAFAPYVPATVTDAGQNGIIGVGTTTIGGVTQPYVDCRMADRISDHIDLLYCYKDFSSEATAPGTLDLSFKHAFCRLTIKMNTSVAPAEGTHILLDSIELTNTTPLVHIGRLTIGSTTAWTWNEADKATHTFVMSNDRTSATDYTHINYDLCYAPDLPAKWQTARGITTTLANVLTVGDYTAYIYLIPQDEDLTFNCYVAYYECVPATGTATRRTKRTTLTIERGKVAMGNTLNLNITLAI